MFLDRRDSYAPAEGAELLGWTRSEMERAVEEGTVEGEDLSGRIERAVRDANDLVSHLTQRLAELSHGSSSFSRTMHQVAVTSENQSKNISDIAATASALTDAAARITELVATFKLGDS